MATATMRWSGPKFTRSGSGWTGEIKYDVINAATDYIALEAVASTFGAHQNATSPDSSYMYCQSVSAVARGFGVWEVTAYFASTPDGRFPVPGYPLAEPTEYVWDFGSLCEQVDRDQSGNPIANTNGDVFENLPSKNTNVVFLTVRKNVDHFDLADAVNCHNTVNSADWVFGPGHIWIAYAGTALCKYVKPLTAITVSSPYVRVEYSFEIREMYSASKDSDNLYDSFKYRVVNAGQRCYWNDGGTVRLAPIVFKKALADGMSMVTEDVRLDANGKPIDTDSFGPGTPTGYATAVNSPYTTGAIVETDISGVVYLKYQMYKTLNFNTAGFNI